MRTGRSSILHIFRGTVFRREAHVHTGSGSKFLHTQALQCKQRFDAPVSRYYYGCVGLSVATPRKFFSSTLVSIVSHDLVHSFYCLCSRTARWVPCVELQSYVQALQVWRCSYACPHGTNIIFDAVFERVFRPGPHSTQSLGRQKTCVCVFFMSRFCRAGSEARYICHVRGRRHRPH